MKIKRFDAFVSEAAVYNVKEIIAYHGSESSIKEFTTEFVKKDKEEGPGIYFSSTENDARMQGPIITKVKLNLKKLVSSRSTINEEIQEQLRYMVNVAPDKDEVLKEWNKDPRKAFDTAMDSIYGKGSPDQAFREVWHEFYQKNPEQYAINMTDKVGYDGVEIWKQRGVKHYVVFNPDSIKVLKSDPRPVVKPKEEEIESPDPNREIEDESKSLKGLWGRDV